MKKILKQICPAILLLLGIAFSSSLFAADLGVKNQYAIGSDEQPVSAGEYCNYLNDTAASDTAWIQSAYYDNSFMNTCCDLWSSSDAAIYRSGWSHGTFAGAGYQYSVIPGHENDRIVAVYSDGIQTEFTHWRELHRTPSASQANDDSAVTPVSAPEDTVVPVSSDAVESSVTVEGTAETTAEVVTE